MTIKGVLKNKPLNEYQYAYGPEKSTDLALDNLTILLTKSIEHKDIFIDTE